MRTHGSQTFQIKPNWNKKPLNRSKKPSENLSLKLLYDVFFRRCQANLTFLALQCPIFNHRSTHESQTSQITPNSNKKPLTRSKGLLENLSLNCCVTSFFRRCVANLTFLTLQCPIFNQFSVRICVWIWICVSNLCPGKCLWLSFSSLKIQMLISASTKELHQICLKQKQPSEVF